MTNPELVSKRQSSRRFSRRGFISTIVGTGAAIAIAKDPILNLLSNSDKRLQDPRIQGVLRTEPTSTAASTPVSQQTATEQVSSPTSVPVTYEARRVIDSTPVPTLPVVSILRLDGEILTLPLYTQKRLKDEGIDTSRPDNFANYNIKACNKALQPVAVQKGTILNRLTSSLERIFITTAEAAPEADITPVPTTKKGFLDCMNGVEDKKGTSFFTDLGYKVDKWTDDNILGVASIKEWRTKLAEVPEIKALNFTQDDINNFLGSSIRTTFRQGNGDLGVFDAQILDLTKAQVQERRNKGERGIHSSEENVWMVKVGDEVLAVFEACQNAFVGKLKKRVPQVSPSPSVPPALTPTPRPADTVTPPVPPTERPTVTVTPRPADTVTPPVPPTERPTVTPAEKSPTSVATKPATPSPRPTNAEALPTRAPEVATPTIVPTRTTVPSTPTAIGSPIPAGTVARNATPTAIGGNGSGGIATPRIPNSPTPVPPGR